MTRKQSQQHDAQRKPSWRVRWKTMSRAVGMEIREHKSSFAVYVVLRMLVLAMLLYRRMGMITPLIVAHGMYDVSTAMTNLTGIAVSSWPLVVGLAIMATPVVWAIVRCARWALYRLAANPNSATTE